MVLLYDKKSMDLMEEKIDEITYEARKYALETVLEPSLDEYKQVMKIILEFIIINKRIIYGGYGWNELIIINSKIIFITCLYSSNDGSKTVSNAYFLAS